MAQPNGNGGRSVSTATMLTILAILAGVFTGGGAIYGSVQHSIGVLEGREDCKKAERHEQRFPGARDAERSAVHAGGGAAPD
jgi:hypothetical protein